MGKRLLLVEDEATLARAMARLLRRAGYDVYLAGTYEEARRASGSFSLGVFDVDLPDGDGIDVAAELKDLGTVKRCVFFSGTTSSARRGRAGKLGAYIEKSKGFPALFATIELTLAGSMVKVSGGEDSHVDESSSPPPSGVRGSGRTTKKR